MFGFPTDLQYFPLSELEQRHILPAVSVAESREELLERLELTGRVPSKDKFRRMACNTFVCTGSCPYNERCVFLHDYRLKCEQYKSKTTKQAKASLTKDTFYWPDMSKKEVCSLLDANGLPDVNQKYSIPESFATPMANMHNRAVYSLWTHFAAFCVFNNSLNPKVYNNIVKEPFFQMSSSAHNRYIKGVKRLETFYRLSNKLIIAPAPVVASSFVTPTTIVKQQMPLSVLSSPPPLITRNEYTSHVHNTASNCANYSGNNSITDILNCTTNSEMLSESTSHNNNNELDSNINSANSKYSIYSMSSLSTNSTTATNTNNTIERVLSVDTLQCNYNSPVAATADAPLLDNSWYKAWTTANNIVTNEDNFPFALMPITANTENNNNDLVSLVTQLDLELKSKVVATTTKNNDNNISSVDTDGYYDNIFDQIASLNGKNVSFDTDSIIKPQLHETTYNNNCFNTCNGDVDDIISNLGTIHHNNVISHDYNNTNNDNNSHDNDSKGNLMSNTMASIKAKNTADTTNTNHCLSNYPTNFTSMLHQDDLKLNNNTTYNVQSPYTSPVLSYLANPQGIMVTNDINYNTTSGSYYDIIAPEDDNNNNNFNKGSTTKAAKCFTKQDNNSKQQQQQQSAFSYYTASSYYCNDNNMNLPLVIPQQPQLHYNHRYYPNRHYDGRDCNYYDSNNTAVNAYYGGISNNNP